MHMWSDRLAVVTGASSGIGAEICRYLVLNGMRVVGLARRIDKLEKIRIQLDAEIKGMFYFFACDVSNDENVVSTFDIIENTHGAISVLVNCAGIFYQSPLTEQPIGDVRKMFHINVLGTLLCTQEAVKSMARHKIRGAQIIFINSVAGENLLTRPNGVIYSATKNALRIIADGFRRELIDKNLNIRTTDVYPGYVLTEMSSSVTLPFSNITPLQPSDIAQACLDILKTPMNVQISKIRIHPVNEP